MVAARRAFQQPTEENDFLGPEFLGTWQLDRVNGLLDEHSKAIASITVTPTSVAIQQCYTDRPTQVTVVFEGPTGEGHDPHSGVTVQALLEGDVLVWELERAVEGGLDRIRRVMRLSEQRSQLIAERVDLGSDGSPRGLRTEYWTRTTIARDRADADYSQ